MPKITQSYVLWQMLTGAKDDSGEYLPVMVEDIVKKLEVNPKSVPVYIFQLRKNYKADIENITEDSGKKKGAKKVIGYKLVNTIVVNAHRANAAHVVVNTEPKPTTPKKTKRSSGSDIPTLDEGYTYDEREISDIRASLSLEDFE